MIAEKIDSRINTEIRKNRVVISPSFPLTNIISFLLSLIIIYFELKIRLKLSTLFTGTEALTVGNTDSSSVTAKEIIARGNN